MNRHTLTSRAVSRTLLEVLKRTARHARPAAGQAHADNTAPRAASLQHGHLGAGGQRGALARGGRRLVAQRHLAHRVQARAFSRQRGRGGRCEPCPCRACRVVARGNSAVAAARGPRASTSAPTSRPGLLSVCSGRPRAVAHGYFAAALCARARQTSAHCSVAPPSRHFRGSCLCPYTRRVCRRVTPPESDFFQNQN